MNITPAWKSVLLLGMACCCQSASPSEQLPAATQQGANTFGCLVNGKVWLPKGNVGTANLDLSYDPSLDGGTFSLITYRIAGNVTQYITLLSDSLSQPGTYEILPPGRFMAYFSQFETNQSGCDYSDYSVVKRSGKLTITQLDLVRHFASGTFEFTLYKKGCDSVTVTKGRFDMPF